MDEGQQLSSDDFYQPLGDLSRKYFNCPLCDFPTNDVVRHPQLEYVATFRCHNHSCASRTNGPVYQWHKCRYCPYKPRHATSANHVHRTLTKEHESNRRAFDGTRTQLAESQHSNVESQPTSPVAHCNPSFEDIGSPTTFSERELDTAASDVSGVSYSPTTVSQWKASFVSQSKDLPTNIQIYDLSKYFRNDIGGEPTGVKDHTLHPMNVQYYEWNLRCPGYGPRMLSANGTSEGLHASSVKLIHPLDSLFYVTLSQFAMKLSKTDQETLCAILNHVMERASEPKHGQYSELDVPRNVSKLRTVFVNGRSSIEETLPRPIVSQVGDEGFVFVRVRDVVQFHLANGGKLDPLLKMEYDCGLPTLHGSCPRAEVVLRLTISGPSTKYLPTEVIVWSDGFDPSANKRNRGSAHVLLVSVGTPQDDYPRLPLECRVPQVF